MKLNEVWEAVGRDGLKMSYAQFRVRLTVKTTAPKTFHIGAGTTAAADERRWNGASQLASAPDPFRNLREQREKTKLSRFECDPSTVHHGC